MPSHVVISVHCSHVTACSLSDHVIISVCISGNVVISVHYFLLEQWFFLPMCEKGISSICFMYSVVYFSAPWTVPYTMRFLLLHEEPDASCVFFCSRNSVMHFFCYIAVMCFFVCVCELCYVFYLLHEWCDVFSLFQIWSCCKCSDATRKILRLHQL